VQHRPRAPQVLRDRDSLARLVETESATSEVSAVLKSLAAPAPRPACALARTQAGVN
jgi:hypothetical protein